MAGENDHLLPVRIFNIYPYSDTAQGVGGIQNFLVFLKGETSKVVPITIGHFEGQALVMALRKIPLPRPLPHNLIQSLLERMNAKVHKLVIHTLKDDVFHAHLLIRTDDDVFYLDCRPSDGMILATLLGAPVFMSPEVLNEAGRELEVEPGGAVQEAEAVEEASAESPAASPETGGEESGEQDTGESAAEPAADTLTNLEKLNVQLARLIAEEAYEEAARVRDRIRELGG